MANVSFFLCAIVPLCLFAPQITDGYQAETYIFKNICGEERFAMGNAYEVYQTSSTPQCASFCLRSAKCKSFNIRKGQGENMRCELFDQYHGRQLLKSEDGSANYGNCSTEVAGNECINSDVISRTCCDLLKEYPTLQNGVYTLCDPTQKDVYCDMDNGGWTVFQRRVDGTVDFERNWMDYVNGFGDLEGNFWLGLENMYRILYTEEHELRIDLEAFDGDAVYAEYSTFNIGSGDDNYRLNVTGFTTGGDLVIADELVRSNGLEFTTIDRDNDLNTNGNCAYFAKGAWWYASCYDANLNGQYNSGPHPIAWKSFKGYGAGNGLIKVSEMKYKPKRCDQA